MCELRANWKATRAPQTHLIGGGAGALRRGGGALLADRHRGRERGGERCGSLRLLGERRRVLLRRRHLRRAFSPPAVREYECTQALANEYK